MKSKQNLNRRGEYLPICWIQQIHDDKVACKMIVTDEAGRVANDFVVREDLKYSNKD